MTRACGRKVGLVDSFSKSGLGACLLIIHRGKEETIEKEKTIEFTCCQHMRQHINVNLFTVTKIITCRRTETAYKISREFPAASLDIIDMPIKGGTFPPDLYGVRSWPSDCIVCVQQCQHCVCTRVSTLCVYNSVHTACVQVSTLRVYKSVNTAYVQECQHCVCTSVHTACVQKCQHCVCTRVPTLRVYKSVNIVCVQECQHCVCTSVHTACVQMSTLCVYKSVNTACARVSTLCVYKSVNTLCTKMSEKECQHCMFTRVSTLCVCTDCVREAREQGRWASKL